jgi:hypothetical protein
MDDQIEREILARLDYIERYLVNLGAVAGYRYATFAQSTTDVPPEVVELARRGQTNDAMKLFRKQTNANAQQAQELVARLAAGEQPWFGSGGGYDSRGADWSGADPGQVAMSGPGADVPADIVAIARSGKLIQAVKAYRDRTGIDLAQAKMAIEQALRPGY